MQPLPAARMPHRPPLHDAHSGGPRRAHRARIDQLSGDFSVDTRNKIIDAEQATALVRDLRRDGANVRIVTGYFDVLLAENVRRLREIANGAGKLFVAVLDPPHPVLALRARAELVA